MIDAATKQRIYDTANIKDVVEDYIPLKRSGVNYVGLCPFHDDKHPSFMVSPIKNICHCFVCGKGGNPVNFLMQKENYTYTEALRELAKKYHIDIKERELSPEEIQQNNERASLSAVNEWLNQHFINNLHNVKEGQDIGMSYLLQKRQLREDIIKKFQLGYSLKQIDGYTKAAVASGYKVEYLRKLGATIHNDERNTDIDRFHGRVIFPIHSISGKVIGFGGRTLITGDNAKYQNSPESDIYHKSQALYGLFFAKKAIQNEKKCYISEGYCDVISMVQAGIENIVAPCGTALTTEQIGILKKVLPSVSPNDDEDKHVTMLYDGDGAGIHAGMKNGPLLLEQGLRVHIVILPPEDDPDTFAHNHSGDEVKKFLEENEKDFVMYYAEQFLSVIQNDPIKRSSAIVDTATVIASIPDKIRRSVYVKECARILEADESLLYDKITDVRQKKANEEAQRRRIEAYRATNAAAQQAQLQPNNAQPIQQPIPQTAPVAQAQPQQTGRELNADEIAAMQTPGYGMPYGQQTAPAQQPEVIKKTLNNETLVVQLMMRFCKSVMFYLRTEEDEKQSVDVGHYIVSELKKDDIELQDPILKLIKDEISARMDDANFDAEKYCLNHVDPNISDLSCRLMTDPRFPETDNDLLHIVPRLVLEMKMDIVKTDIDKMLAQLKDCTEETRQDLLTRLMHKMAVKQELSNKTGMVVNGITPHSQRQPHS